MLSVFQSKKKNKQQTGMVVMAALASPGKEDKGILDLAGQLV